MRALGWCLILGGCFSPSFDSGKLRCSTDSNQCPSGFACISGVCWKNGEGPDLSAVTDDGGGLDDLGIDDLAGPEYDMAMPRMAGQLCNNAGECVTGFCADGVCCDQACDGACVSCKLVNQAGSCVPVPRGNSSPGGHPSCVAADPSTCQLDGTCDGNGACALWPQLTVCKPSKCDSGSQKVTPSSTCDGKGTCLNPSPFPCAPYLCQDATQCWPACNDAMMGVQCAPPNACVNSSCGKKSQGAVCSSDGDCQSNHCADNHCCDSACTGTCEACDLAATIGTCTPVSGAARHGSCAGGASNCGSACDGSNRTTCVFTAGGTGCNDGDACTYGDICDGSGGCHGTALSCPASSTCVSYSCNGTATCSVSYAGGATSCNDGNLCTYGDHCDGAGGCVGTTVTCPGNSSCTTYSCNGTSTCTTTYKGSGTGCGTCHCGSYQCDGMGGCKPNGCLGANQQCP